MTVNEEGRQTEIADELVTIAQKLAHSTRSVPRPSDSYGVLGSLQAAQDMLAQVYEQLATGHKNAVDGTHYDGVDGNGLPDFYAVGPDGQATGLLEMAAASAAESAALIRRAHTAGGVVRWFDDVSGDELG